MLSLINTYYKIISRLRWLKLVYKPKFDFSRSNHHHSSYRLCLLIIIGLLCIQHNTASAGSLVDYFRDSIKKKIEDQEKPLLSNLSKINEQIKREVTSGEQISSILNNIDQKGLEKEALKEFLMVVNLRKKHNDQIDARLDQLEAEDANKRKRITKIYQPLKVDLIPDRVKEYAYLYPIVIPFAGYVQPGAVSIADINKKWLQNEKNFDFCFFYLLRKFVYLDKTQKTYDQLCKKSNIVVENGRGRLTKYFNGDIGFGFFEEKFDTGVFNKQSKFFAFDGYIYKYLKGEHTKDTGQNSLIKTFKTYCAYKAYCDDCDLLKFYKDRKLVMFNAIMSEMEQALKNKADRLEAYLKPMYYLSRTFPNLSPFLLTHKDGKYKFTNREEKPMVMNKLRTLWKNIEASEKDAAKVVNLLKYTLGAVYLLPQKEVNPADEEYDFDRSGYATYMQEYIEIYNKYKPAKNEKKDISN